MITPLATTGIENVDADWLKNMAIFLAAGIVSAHYLRGFFKKEATTPQPLIVKGELQYVESNEFEKLDTYVHKSVHDLRGELQAITLNETESSETLKNLREQVGGLATQVKAGFEAVDNRRSRSIGELHGQLKNAELKLAAVAADTTTTARQVDTLNGKIDRLLERIPRKP